MKKLYATLSLLLAACTISMAQPAVFDDDYAAGISFSAFGGSANSLTIDAANARPGSSGTKSLKVDVPAAGYTGGAMVAATNANLSAYNAVSFWVKASKAVTLNVSGLGNNAASDAYQTELNNVAVSTSWVKVIIPIPDASKLTAINGLFHFAEGSDEGAYTLWFDDITYENLTGGIIGTPTAVMDNQNLTKAVGGTFTATGVRATFPVNSVNTQITLKGVYLTFTSNPVGRITFDANGICTAATVGSATVTATLQGAAVTGSISVTVSGAASEPTTAAPTPPARSAGDVLSVYSAAYTNVTGINWNPNWGQSTVVSEVQVAGNDTRKYANLNYQGFEFTPALNLTGMTKLHFDIWSPDCTQFQFYLISPGPVEIPATITPTLSGWKSVDVDLSNFSPVVLSNVFQFKIVGTPFGTSTVWLDNIYFYKSAALPTSPTTAAPTPPARNAGDVISVFSNAYTNITGVNFNPGWGQSTVIADEQIAGNDTKKYSTLNYQGFELSPALNLTGMTKLHFDLWTPNSTQFKFFLISPGPVESAVTVTPTLSEWVSVDVDLSTFGSVVMNNVFQFKLESLPFGTTTAWLDNIYFYKEGSLPVKFNGFTAAANAGAVLLKWGTASESNNKGFTVEKSADGLTWSDIGFVAGAGNSNSQRQYVFTDNKPGKGNNYYRLKQTDLDGKQAFSEVRMVNMAAKRGAVSVFPNPAKGMVYLNTDAVSGTLQYQLLSMNGKAVLSGQVNVSNGQQSINIQTVPAGTYLLRLTANGVSSTEKLIVQ